MAFMAPAMSFVAAFFRSVGVASGARRRVSRSCLFVFDFFTTLVLSVENIGLAGGPEATSAELLYSHRKSILPVHRLARAACRNIEVHRRGREPWVQRASREYCRLH